VVATTGSLTGGAGAGAVPPQATDSAALASNPLNLEDFMVSFPGAHHTRVRATLRAMNFRKVAKYFLRGALVTAPFGLTIYIVLAVLSALDKILPIGIPGLGLVLTLIAITLIGLFTSNFVGKNLLDTAERGLAKVPLVKLIYSSIKDLIGAFVGDKKSFDRPVCVRLAGDDGPRALGFITRDNVVALGFPGFVAVYLPQSYNFAGSVVLVASEKVEPLDVPSSELMTFIVSGGVSGFGLGQSMLPDPPRLPGAAGR
jgi:uncharacterized membrane protein